MTNSIQFKSNSYILHVIPFWHTFICVNVSMTDLKFINTARRYWLFILAVVCLYTSLQHGFFMIQLALALKKTNVNTVSSLNDFVSKGKESHINKQKPSTFRSTTTLFSVFWQLKPTSLPKLQDIHTALCTIVQMAMRVSNWALKSVIAQHTNSNHML